MTHTHRIGVGFVGLLLAALAGMGCCEPALALTLDMVDVGNAGNAADARYVAGGLGAVGYEYRISKYEITAGQWTEFLNAVAKADPNTLYSTQMANIGGAALGCNIQRAGAPGSYSYSVAADWANRPVNWVTLWDAARFANWLHNGQPIGAQGPGTTEDGAYLNIGSQAAFARQAGAKFYIPTEDEWYKAAYHDKSAGTAAAYFDYARGTNVAPGVDPTEVTSAGNNSNYKKDDNYVIGAPYYRTVVGEFALSGSPYGTFDQGGNVFEWVETKAGTDYRYLHGGSFIDSALISQHALDQSAFNVPTTSANGIGFRLAASPVPVPEPATAAAALVGIAAMAARARRRVPDLA